MHIRFARSYVFYYKLVLPLCYYVIRAAHLHCLI